MKMNYNEFVNKWNGKSGIPNPSTNEYAGQCVSLIRNYMVNVLEISLSGISGNAKDYWYRRNQAPLNKYFDAVPYVKGMSFQKGDIFILGPTSENEFGHIGLCFGESNQNQMHIFDSNYKNQRTCYDRWRGYDGMLGILRPKEYLQSKIGDEVVNAIEFTDFMKVFVINRVTNAGYYALRDKAIDGEIKYKAKVGDYFIPIKKSKNKLKDGFYWYEVQTHGGDTYFIQYDPDYIREEDWTV